MFKILLGFNFFYFRWLLRCSECFLCQRMCGGGDEEERILRPGALTLFDFSEAVSDLPWTLGIFLFICCCLGAKSCSTLCDPMDWNPPGSFVHRIFQLRIPEWVAMPSSRGFSWPRGWNCSLCYSLLKVTRRKTCSLFSFLIRSLCLSLHDDWTLPWLERRGVDNAPNICSNLSAGCTWLVALLSVSQSVSSVTQSCLTFCDPMNHSMPGLPVHHQLLEFTQTHVHWVSDAIQPSHPLLSPSPPAPNPSQHQGLFQWGDLKFQPVPRKNGEKALLLLHARNLTWLFLTPHFQALMWNREEGVMDLTMSSVFLFSTHPWGSPVLPCAINILPRSQPICSLFLQSLVKAEVQTTNL